MAILDISSNLAKIQEQLAEFPKTVGWAVRSAIKYALARGASVAKADIRKRYHVPRGTRLAAYINQQIGKPKMTGDMSGGFKSSGSKVPAYLFNNRAIPPFGVAWEEMEGGAPSNILSAFKIPSQDNERIWMRTSKDQYPIRPITTLSAPDMIGSKTIEPDIMAKMREAFENRLATQIKFKSKGGLVVNSYGFVEVLDDGFQD